MKPLPHENFETHRAFLAEEIARQRGDLSRAFAGLEKPIHYAENGLTIFGFLRKNAWIFTAVPAFFSVTTGALQLKKILSNKPEPEPRLRRSLEETPRIPKRGIAHWAGHGWRLYKVYRQVRRFL